MSPLRSRSAGVTAAATYAILCCATAFVLWGYLILLIVNAPPDDQGQHIYELFPIRFALLVIVPPAIIAVGVRTAIGLLNLKPWARRTSMVWAAVALTLCLSIIAFRPFETFVVPHKFVKQAVLTKQMIAISVVLMLLPVSVWWLFYFRTKNVKLQFLPRDASGTAESTEKNRPNGWTGKSEQFRSETPLER